MEKIGKYQIEGVLGAGAMGKVYKGIDPLIGRVVAIKVLGITAGMPEETAEEIRSRFIVEAQAAGKLNHPNIVTIYDIDYTEAGEPYMAMEYVPGKTLKELVKGGGAMAPHRAFNILEQVASALEFAHERKVVHRDIKPDNIMVGENDEVKLMDFGVAHLGDSELTQAGQVLGTPAYMSPEQVQGKMVDGRSDLFSLGVIAYELLTGGKPFRGDNLTAIAHNVVYQDPEPLQTMVPELPAGCSQIGKKMLHKNPDQRYQSGLHLRKDLEDWRNGRLSVDDLFSEDPGDSDVGAKGTMVAPISLDPGPTPAASPPGVTSVPTKPAPPAGVTPVATAKAPPPGVTQVPAATPAPPAAPAPPASPAQPPPQAAAAPKKNNAAPIEANVTSAPKKKTGAVLLVVISVVLVLGIFGVAAFAYWKKNQVEPTPVAVVEPPPKEWQEKEPNTPTKSQPDPAPADPVESKPEIIPEPEPTREPEPEPEPVADSSPDRVRVSDVDDSEPATAVGGSATVKALFEHKVGKGWVRVKVNGKEVWYTRFRGSFKKKFQSKIFTVPPGTYDVDVDVHSSDLGIDKHKDRTLVVEDGDSKTLYIRLKSISKRIEVEIY